jgi:hypothetical protein
VALTKIKLAGYSFKKKRNGKKNVTDKKEVRQKGRKLK